ncbi:MAG: hypothetical protein EKK64_03020 [Neisseriaceae bacterium]|nr:MAG: hypothetical protein EKK64_03020 [Neisseriaceae bacterium]
MKLTEFPELMKQLHPTKNFGIDPSTISHGTHKKIWWLCPDCSHEWDAAVNNRVIRKSGCPNCWKKVKQPLFKPYNPHQVTVDKFIEKSRAVHGDKYSYDLARYKNLRTLIKITCPLHGEFERTPVQHIAGSGCLICLNHEKFLKKARELHGDKYDYSKVEYTKSDAPVTIICPIHGEFQHTPKKHIFYGCVKCGIIHRGISTRLSQDEFLKRAKEIHGDKYDYSKVSYVKSDEFITVVCPIHGDFEIKPSHHCNQKQGCRKCGIIKVAKDHAFTNDEFIQKSRSIHKDKYDYKLVHYNNGKEKQQIICLIHGIFFQKGYNHVNGSGCPDCNVYKKQDQSIFLHRARNVHGCKYSYSKSVYVNINKHVIVTCPKHGDFQVAPHYHLNSGVGCPTCCESHGEKKVRVYLESNNIKFKPQWRFNDDTVKKMRFDFVLLHNNNIYVIEYQGRQHYIPHSFSSNKTKSIMNNNLHLIVKRDKIKKLWCKSKGLKFLAIPFWEINKIDKIIEKFISDENVEFVPPPKNIEKYVSLVHKHLTV